MNITNAEMKTLPLSALHNNEGQVPGLPANPRVIRDEKFRALVERLRKNNLTGLKPLIVYEHGGQYIVLGGNQRLRALKELKAKDVSCLIVPAETSTDVLSEIVIIDNTNDGEYDWDALADEWEMEDLKDWGVDLPAWTEEEPETEQDIINRKMQEFNERMAAGEISEEDEEYQEFLDKFKLKKTTDDCYTPGVVYDAVADYVAECYSVNRADFVRPFYPGGDYQKETYPEGCVVVDNPPFSILAEILKFYRDHNIRFFLFAPSLTLFSSSSSKCTCICTGVTVTYENGANVNTSFLTNMDSEDVRLRSDPKLFAAVRDANEKNLEAMKKNLPKYEYPSCVVTSHKVSRFSRLGIYFSVRVNESISISALDSQKETGKAIYGKGYLISEKATARREAAEREAAVKWKLSDRELALIKKLH